MLVVLVSVALSEAREAGLSEAREASTTSMSVVGMATSGVVSRIWAAGSISSRFLQCFSVYIMLIGLVLGLPTEYT